MRGIYHHVRETNIAQADIYRRVRPVFGVEHICGVGSNSASRRGHRARVRLTAQRRVDWRWRWCGVRPAFLFLDGTLGVLPTRHEFDAQRWSDWRWDWHWHRCVDPQEGLSNYVRRRSICWTDHQPTREGNAIIGQFLSAAGVKFDLLLPKRPRRVEAGCASGRN